MTATVTGRRGEEDAHSLFCDQPIINLQKSLEMYTWGRNVRLGGPTPDVFLAPHVHISLEGTERGATHTPPEGTAGARHANLYIPVGSSPTISASDTHQVPPG